MVSGRRLVVVAVALATILAWSAWGSTTCRAEGDARAEIQAQYDAMSAAFRASNVAGYMAVLADDFVTHNKNGTVDNRTKVEKDVRNILEGAKDPSLTFRIVEFTPHGDTVDVKQDQVFRGATQPDPDGKTHLIEAQGTMLDTWKKTPAGWRLINQEEKASTMTVDGKIQE